MGGDERGLVLRDALQPLRLAGPVIALDGVQGQAQAAGAVQQARALLPQVTDLLPAFPGGIGPFAFLHGRALGPAAGVRQDLFAGSLAQEVPQMPPVADLHRLRQRPARCLAVGPRAVTAHDLDSRMPPQPCLGRVRGPAGDDVHPPAGLGVDEHGRVDQAAAQREVVDPQHPRHRKRGQGNLEEDPQRGMPGNPDAQRRQQPRRGPAR